MSKQEGGKGHSNERVALKVKYKGKRVFNFDAKVEGYPLPQDINFISASEKKFLMGPMPENEMTSKQVYNPGFFRDDEGNGHLFPRTKGEDGISRIFHAKRAVDGDGTFVMDEKPFLEPDPTQPEEITEKIGVEDFRVTKMDKPFLFEGEQYDCIASYTGVKPRTAMVRVFAFSSTDFDHRSKRYPMFPDWDMDKPEKEKDKWNQGYKGRNIIWAGVTKKEWDPETMGNWSKAAAIFPEKIDGKFAALWGEWRGRYAESEDGVTWKSDEKPLISTRKGKFDSGYVEMGPPPMRITVKEKDYWLVIYNGVNSLKQKGRVYGTGWVLLDIEDPRKVVSRCEEPIIVPDQTDETTGSIDIVNFKKHPILLPFGKRLGADKFTDEDYKKYAKKIPMAVFCNGAEQNEDGTFTLYYGAGDKVTKQDKVVKQKFTKQVDIQFTL